MATWKQVILKDPITGEYLAPLGGNFSGGDADTLQSHPASDFLLKSEYTPVDLSEYLKTATADTKYAAVDHNHNGAYAPVSHTHTTGQISDLSAVLAGYAPASHTHSISQITGLQSELNSLKSSVSEGKSLVAAAVTDKGVTTAADAAFQTIANNIGKITAQEYFTVTLSGKDLNTGGAYNDYYFTGQTLQFVEFTVNGVSSGTIGELGTTLRVPKYGVIMVEYNPDSSYGLKRITATVGGKANPIPSWENDYGDHRIDIISIFADTSMVFNIYPRS